MGFHPRLKTRHDRVVRTLAIPVFANTGVALDFGLRATWTHGDPRTRFRHKLHHVGRSLRQGSQHLPSGDRASRDWKSKISTTRSPASSAGGDVRKPTIMASIWALPSRPLSPKRQGLLCRRRDVGAMRPSDRACALLFGPVHAPTPQASSSSERRPCRALGRPRGSRSSLLRPQRIATCPRPCRMASAMNLNPVNVSLTSTP